MFATWPARHDSRQWGIRFRSVSRTSWARCCKSRATASRPSLSSIKLRAHRVMWVYASGKSVAEFLLRLKNARGRPRPPALNERSTRPFASSPLRCFSVAIFEIRSSPAMSVSETVPRRFNVSRICLFAEEKPASSPPGSTSSVSAMGRKWPSNIIYLFVYKIGFRNPPSDEERRTFQVGWAQSRLPLRKVLTTPSRCARPMQTRTLGRTGLKVSEIGFGAWAIGGNAHGNSYGPTDDAESIAAVQRAIDMGVNFFDTADVYGWGHSEEVLGEALGARRDGVHIATKVGGDFYHGGVRMNFEPGYIAFALERSLKRLRTDHVDVYQLHNPPAEMMGDPETYEMLEALKTEHKI